MKEEIVAKLEDLIKEEISDEVFLKADEIKNEFLLASQHAEHEIHEKMLADGNGAEEAPQKDPLDGRFNELMHILDDRARKFKKLKKEEVVSKMAAKEAVIDELQKLISGETNIGKAFNEFKALQQRWNEIGNIPNRSYKNLQAAYHRHVHNFYYNMKLSKDLRDLDLKRNLEFRLQLLSKIESLLAMDSVKGMERMLGLYRMEWSELGPTVIEKTDELRTQYRELISKVLQKIRDHYQERQQYESENLQIKNGLLEKLRALGEESLDSPRKWQKTADQVNDLVKEWKNTGYVSKQENEKIWNEFKKALSGFHSSRRQYFSGLKKEYRQHKETKLDIISKADEIASKTYEEWEVPTRNLVQLQKQWKDAGHVDNWDEHKLWKKFREACDKFFNAKRDFFAEMDKALEVNLEKKEELLKRLEAFAPSGHADEDVKALREFSLEWKSIPHVPFKDKQRIYEQYKKTLDAKYDSLKLEASQVHLIKFKNNVELLAHSQDASHLLQKERMLLQDRVKKLQSTITQYENNLGFFTNSKNMGGLLKEVEGNLDKARAELDLLKKKLKVFSEFR
jgi:hypothetical protein